MMTTTLDTLVNVTASTKAVVLHACKSAINPSGHPPLAISALGDSSYTRTEVANVTIAVNTPTQKVRSNPSISARRMKNESALTPSMPKKA